MKFRKKPVVIAAMQFTSNNEVGSPTMDNIVNWMNQGRDTPNAWHNGTYIFVRTLEGEMRAEVGDWIIRGVKGEFYPCKPDIFAATYDADGERWLCVGDGEGCGDTRIVGSREQIVQFLWEEVGVDHSGSEEQTRKYWAEYLADEDNWMPIDGDPFFRCTFDVGETGHIMIQRIQSERNA